MKHIYIFNSAVRATNYGVGTYIKQLTGIFKGPEYRITVVKIVFEDKEFEILDKSAIRYIIIPAPVINKDNLNQDAFDKSIPFILYPYINRDENNIFHINYIETKYLAENLKSLFGGSIVLTVHYTDWSFSLLGNRRKLQAMVKKDDSELNTASRNILKNLNEEKKTINVCDKIIAISEHSYNDLIKIHKAEKDKITLINNALTDSHNSKEETAAIRKKLLIADDDFVIVFAGRLDPIKGVHILIDSFKSVLEQHPNSRLIIAGEGAFNKWLSDSSPVWTRISFTGFLSKKTLQEIYSIADIGVVPSLHEEFGYVAIEMMSHKIPVIVNDTTGLSEIIDDNINGLKVSIKTRSKTSKELVDKINYLIENPDVRERLGENAKEKFKTHYNIKLFGKRMLSLYNSL